MNWKWGTRLAVLATSVGLAGFGQLSAGAGTAMAGTYTDGAWTLDAPSTTATDYSAQVQPPINADGTSSWPSGRGVIPVKFKVTKATTEKFVFESLQGATDHTAWSWLGYTPPTGTTVADLQSLTANFAYAQGQSTGGSLRWSIATPAGEVHVYYGVEPNWTGTGGSGDNLLAATDLRFDTTQVGGTFYDTYDHMIQLVGSQPVNWVALVLDSGWSQGDQIVNVTDASVDGNTFTWPAEVTTGAAQDNSQPAYLYFEHIKAGVPDIDYTFEPVISAQGDKTGQYRQIDGMYMYNLDLKALKAQGYPTGMYNVGIRMGAPDAPSVGGATFQLR